KRRRLHNTFHFEAQSRGLLAPCVRFAARLAPAPRNTRFRLVASLLPVRDFHPAGSIRSFPSNIPSHDFLLLQAWPGAPSAETIRPRASAETFPARASAEPPPSRFGKKLPSRFRGDIARALAQHRPPRPVAGGEHSSPAQPVDRGLTNAET